GDLAGDAALETCPVRGEQVVAQELHPVAEAPGRGLPAGPVVVGQRVLDRHHREIVDPTLELVDELVRVAGPALDGQHVAVGDAQLVGRDVDGQRDVAAGYEATPFGSL